MIQSKSFQALQSLSVYNTLSEQLYVENVEDVDSEIEPAAAPRNVMQRLESYLTSANLVITCLYLFCLGILTSLLAFLYELIEVRIVWLKEFLTEQITDIYAVRFLLWILHTLFFATLAAAMPVFITKNGEGSGIPELKSILSGIVLHRYLSLRTLLAKFFGLVFGAGAGLFTGREGPFVCLGGCVAHLLCKLPVFRARFLKNQSQHLSMLAAGSAVGIVSTFGTPIGGVVFSLEVTATYYMVRDLWKGFFASVCATAFFTYIRFSGWVPTMHYTEFSSEVPWNWEVIFFVFLGVLSGITGAWFNILSLKIGKFKKKYKWLKESKFRVTIAAALLTAVISFPLGTYMSNEWDTAMDRLFSLQDLPYEWRTLFHNPSTWTLVPTLLIFSFVRLAMVALTTNLPIPTGIFVPSLCIGGGIGRMMGEIVRAYIPNTVVDRGIYALAGAAATCTGTTHSISTAIILLEMTGQVYHLLHVLLTVLVAYGVTNSICPSYYENALLTKGIPYMPFLNFRQSSANVARDIMIRDVKYVSLENKPDDVLQVLLQSPNFISFPLIDSPVDMTLLGSVSRSALERVCTTAGLINKPKDSKNETWEEFVRLVKELRHRGRGRATASASVPPSSSPSTVPLITVTNDNGSRPIRQHNGYLRVTTDEDDVHSTGSEHVLQPMSASSHSAISPYSEIIEEPSPLPPSPSAHQATAALRRTPLSEFPHFSYDPSPVELVELAPISKVHFYFTMLACNHAYVTCVGRLVGVITKKNIIASRAHL